MKTRFFTAICTIVMLFAVSTMSAQSFKISAFGQEGFVMGDITLKEINNNSAGYVNYGTTGGIEINYYLKNNLGFGIRWAASTYGRDTEAYEADLIKILNISNNNYDITQSYSFVTFGSDIGISYLVKFNDKLNLEPYCYIGFRGLVSPYSSVIYSQNGTTYQYKSKSRLFFGLNYSPGVKFNWNAFKCIGFYCSLEYNGKMFFKDDERSIVYSYNTLNISDTEKEYRIRSLNFGLGISLMLGKRQDK